MGNNCVAGGECPHRADILITNNTKFELELDQDQTCGRECEHKGFQVLDGKIVEGQEPPLKISAYSIGRFSVSGREATAVAPKGKVFYVNKEENLSVIFEWNATGWTSTSTSIGNTVITGISPKPRGIFKKEPKPWNQVLIGTADHKNWTYEIRESKGALAEAKETIDNLTNINVNI